MKREHKSSKAIMLRVTDDGRFEPYDDMSRELLRKKRLRRGDVISATLKKARNPTNWRRAHKLAQLLIQNLDEFANGEAHAVLKRLQLEADIGCDYIACNLPGIGAVHYRVPKSLAFDEMEETEFDAIYGQFCQHIINAYWPELTPDEIEEMAGLVGLAA